MEAADERVLAHNPSYKIGEYVGFCLGAIVLSSFIFLIRYVRGNTVSANYLIHVGSAVILGIVVYTGIRRIGKRKVPAEEF